MMVNSYRSYSSLILDPRHWLLDEVTGVNDGVVRHNCLRVILLSSPNILLVHYELCLLGLLLRHLLNCLDSLNSLNSILHARGSLDNKLLEEKFARVICQKGKR